MEGLQSDSIIDKASPFTCRGCHFGSELVVNPAYTLILLYSILNGREGGTGVLPILS